jgi:hypothetical protein
MVPDPAQDLSSSSLGDDGMRNLRDTRKGRCHALLRCADDQTRTNAGLNEGGMLAVKRGPRAQ